MSCFDGNIYIRKDYIVCDPNYGVSLKDLVEKIVNDMPIGGGSSTFTFSCSLLSSCSIGSLSNVDLSGIASGNVLKWNGTTFVPGIATPTLGSIPNVSNGADALNNTTDVGRILVWGSQNQWVPGVIPATTNTVKLNVGAASDQSDELTLTDSTSTTSKLTIQGSGKISVTYDPDTNTFTITDFTSPAFVGFNVYVDEGSDTTLYFGETLSYVNFAYSSVSAYSGVTSSAGIKLQRKVGSSYSNLATGITYNSSGSKTYTLADGSLADQTYTTFASETFRLEGQSTQAGAFYSSTSSIKWITNYYYGYTTDKSHTFTIANLTTGSGTAPISGRTTEADVDKKAFDFTFSSPSGKYIWLAVPTSILTTSGGSIVDTQFILGSNTLGFISTTVANVPSGSSTIEYTVIISSAPQTSALTINFK
jgi:hypothetical protein